MYTSSDLLIVTLFTVHLYTYFYNKRQQRTQCGKENEGKFHVPLHVLATVCQHQVERVKYKSAVLLQSITVHQYITKLYGKFPVFPSLISVFREK